jgi:hypothetical protein
MKKHFTLFVLALLFAGFCFAQEEESTPSQKSVVPKWVSSKGYWVVEGNVHTPKSNVIYFYTTDNVLVYKEKVEGMKIKVAKAKVCMKLKTALEQAVTLWEATHIAKENETLVALALKK